MAVRDKLAKDKVKSLKDLAGDGWDMMGHDGTNGALDGCNFQRSEACEAQIMEQVR